MLLIGKGGDNTIQTDIGILNDTGSEILTIYDTDIVLLSCAGHGGSVGHVFITDANGGLSAFPRWNMEIQLTTEDGDAWSPWIREAAAEKSALSGASRLSGSELRRQFFIGTNRAYDMLAVSATLGGMSANLR